MISYEHPTKQEIEQAKEGVHKRFKKYFYQGLFRITHTKENFHLVHVGCTWSAATHKDPLSYKCLEDNNLKRYFDYILYHELQATTKLYKELNQAKKRYETNTELRCKKQLRTDYQIKLDEWHAFYYATHLAYLSMIAAQEEHTKVEIKYLKKYLTRQRKKYNYHFKHHKLLMKPVKHEMCFYHRAIKSR